MSHPMKEIRRVSMKDTKKSYMKRTIGAVLASPSECHKKKKLYAKKNVLTTKKHSHVKQIMLNCIRRSQFTLPLRNFFHSLTIKLHNKLSLFSFSNPGMSK